MATFHPYEDEGTEFKRELTDTFEKEVVAFLNSAKGGHIYIGVENDGTVIGVNDPDKLPLAITDRIKNNILPTTLGFFDVVTQDIQGKPVIRIIVTRGTEKPYYLKKYGLSPAGAHIRIGTGTQQLTTKLIDRLYASRTRNSLRNIPSPMAKLSFNQLKIYYDEKDLPVNEYFPENLDLYTPNGELNYVAYLLADENRVSIKVAKYAGTDKVDLMENEEYGYCSLIKATDRVLDKLEVENKTFTKITGGARRLQKSMIDRRALREALINAMVHNDYTCEVTPVVEIYADRLTITSYGGLISGLSKEEFFDGRSMVRNREIMRIYRDLKLVEQLGSGVDRILHAYSQDIFCFSENFLEVCFKFTEGYIESLKESKRGVKEIEKRGEKGGRGGVTEGEKRGEKRDERGVKEVEKRGEKRGGNGDKGGLKEDEKRREKDDTIGVKEGGERYEKDDKRGVEKSIKEGENGDKRGVEEDEKRGEKDDKRGVKEDKKRGEKDGKGGVKERGKMGENRKKILNTMRNNPTVSQASLVEIVGIGSTSIEKNIKYLKDHGWIKRVGPAKGGHWEVIDE
ncbi:putative DNA binding domain-containing protein [Candidatus Haliotispira prima]|uniref:DNA binding domain-containing protein n=1 Tax=Candidatus Haliotispira prima TaxID=3034016 RepID=A0ABY8MK31_9SPIO|nr:putative DNA binding domain-containing protein [Candidatus Haliotispira prima]